MITSGKPFFPLWTVQTNVAKHDNLKSYYINVTRLCAPKGCGWGRSSQKEPKDRGGEFLSCCQITIEKQDCPQFLRIRNGLSQPSSASTNHLLPFINETTTKKKEMILSNLNFRNYFVSFRRSGVSWLPCNGSTIKVFRLPWVMMKDIHQRLTFSFLEMRKENSNNNTLEKILWPPLVIL